MIECTTVKCLRACKDCGMAGGGGGGNPPLGMGATATSLPDLRNFLLISYKTVVEFTHML